MASQTPPKISTSSEIHSEGLYPTEQDVARAGFAAVHARLQTLSLPGCRALDMFGLTRQIGHNTTTLHTKCHVTSSLITTRPISRQLLNVNDEQCAPQ